MTSGSRRVLLYWVLLLLPTLAVGGGVWWLLGRERSRVEEQTRAATETRHAAVAARARLIAENVELLVGDVQSALMSTLLEAPADDTKLEKYFAEWKRTNPLVKTTFSHTSNDDERKRLSRLIEQDAVSKNQKQAFSKSAPSTQIADIGSSYPQTAVSNSAQVSSLRSQLQETAKIRSDAVGKLQQTGWISNRDPDGTLHLVGWRRLMIGRVIGVEVQLSQVAARLSDVLPAEREVGEVYELREIGHAVYKQRSLSSFERATYERAPLITVPVSDAVLPGWEVAGYFDEETSILSGGTFFAISAILAVVLVAAILAGGTLLLRQARRSEEEALQKTSFVANVSHELKTPLTTIRLYSELLEQNRVPDPEKRTEYLRTIGRETQRLTRLVNNVLGFSRLDQGKKRFDLVEMDVSEELIRLLEAQRPALAASGLVLRWELPAMAEDAPDKTDTARAKGEVDGARGVVRPMRVKIDRDAFEQILLNLLDNACKYAASGGEVLVSLHAINGERGLHLVVADRGPGVPVSQRERIFEKFHRVDEALTAEKGGAGLGLSIARQLARGLGGELRCAERKGGGAEFIFELP